MTNSITCPICGMVSYHPEDIKQKYCGNCHQFHDILLYAKENNIEKYTDGSKIFNNKNEGKTKWTILKNIVLSMFNKK